MAEEITSSTEQIENCTPETSLQEENFQETELQSNVNEVQESVSEDEEVQMQESTIESSEVESEIASELDSTVEESTSELDTTSASEVDNDLLQKCMNMLRFIMMSMVHQRAIRWHVSSMRH